MLRYGTERVTLPFGLLSDEVHVAMSRKTWEQLSLRLRAEAPNEACAFVLTRPSRGVQRTSAVLSEIIWPNDNDVVATPSELEISSDYISRALDAAVDAGPLVGVSLVHTHPKGWFGEGVAKLSPRDDWYEYRLFPTIANSRPEALSASVVLGSAGGVDARVWWRESSRVLVQPAHAVRIVGPELTYLETPNSAWVDHLDPDLMDRSTRIWGREGLRRLQNLRVGIVGVGGTGSLCVFALATMGLGHILIWDRDIAKKQNRHRTAGISREYVNKAKVDALKALARTFSTADPFEVIEYNDWATNSDGLRRLKDCDIIFCCVDKLAPRVPLNDLAYAHLVPTIDMSSWIHANAKNQVDALMAHAHVWSPGIPCAWCRETLSSYGLTREAQGSQQGIEFRVPYGLTATQTDGIEPSVLPLNMVSVSLALMEFMQVALKITTRTPHDLKFTIPEWELDESDRAVRIDCDCISSVRMADAIRIRPVQM